ncbi:MAG: cupin domain-containing protein [Burkholderiales bacterium]
MIELEVLNGQRDGLHDFAEWFLNNATFNTMNKICKDIVDTDGALGTVLHQDGQYQCELISFKPNFVIPPHTHVGTDNIIYLIAGAVFLTVGDYDPYKGMSARHVRRVSKGRGLRIPQNAVHYGTASNNGAMILSFQRWSVPVTHIGNNWQGEPASELQRELSEQYANSVV